MVRLSGHVQREPTFSMSDFESLNPAAMAAFVCLAAVILDLWLGEPRRWHPLVGFGRCVSWVETQLNRRPDSAMHGLIAGIIGVLMLVALPVAGLVWLSSAFADSFWWVALEIAALYLALSIRGLSEHGQDVASALKTNDLTLARQQVARIVSRNTEALDESGVASAATESMLENGADAVFASLFWYLVAGLPGVVAHRLINTLDAMWGYRTSRFRHFGCAAARLDDVMNWPPARLTALTYALLGKTRLALKSWRKQARHWDSPNAGPVMSSGAGALGVRLGGPAPYSEGVKQRPQLGGGRKADAQAVTDSIRLVFRGVWLWLAILAVVAVFHWAFF